MIQRLILLKNKINYIIYLKKFCFYVIESAGCFNQKDQSIMLYTYVSFVDYTNHADSQMYSSVKSSLSLSLKTGSP